MQPPPQGLMNVWHLQLQEVAMATGFKRELGGYCNSWKLRAKGLLSPSLAFGASQEPLLGHSRTRHGMVDFV